MAPRPCKISEALYIFWYWGQDEGTASISYICRSTESCSRSKNSLHYYSLYSLSVFSLAKSLQLLLEINTTYRFRPVINRWGPGISPSYYERSPRLLSYENKRKIEPKEIFSCLTSRPNAVFTRQLETLVTALQIIELADNRLIYWLHFK